MGGALVTSFCVTNEGKALGSLLAKVHRRRNSSACTISVAGRDQRLVQPHLQQPRMQRCKAPSSTSHH